jgi:glycerol kinase
LPHKQIIDEKGWVEHDPKEIMENTVAVLQKVIEKAGIDRNDVVTLGISNQRETAMVWDRISGEPVYNAIVWQCARGAKICERLEAAGKAAEVQAHTGLPLSPYFSGAKIAWVLEQVPGAKKRAQEGQLCCGTIDSWLIYNLTGKKEFKTDYSNASRTQLFNIHTLCWDADLCEAFGIPTGCLAQVCDSNSLFGETDLEGYLEKPIPIYAALGDSHGALFGQGCHKPGMVKATYGTGSSVMMNIGDKPVESPNGLVTSLAWGMDGKVQYVLEGNINYTGAVITWLQKDLGLIASAKETAALAQQANQEDRAYLVPAFTGLGAPYWDSQALAGIFGISRTTGKAELVKAALESIGYQITDIIEVMGQDSGIAIEELRVDGGPTRNPYLMQFQSDMAAVAVQVPAAEELSGIGAAYAAGLRAGVYEREALFSRMERSKYQPRMEKAIRNARYQGWKEAVAKVLVKK